MNNRALRTLSPVVVRLTSLVSLALALFAPVPAVAQEPTADGAGTGSDAFLESVAGAQAISLGMLELRPRQPGAKPLPAELLTVLEQDLTLPGRFRLLRSPRIDSAAWVAENALSFLHGQYAWKGDSSLVLELYLTDLISMEVVEGVSRVYTVKLSQSRRAIHDFADRVVQQFYGEEGVASTRLLFVRKSGKGKEIWMSDYDGANAREVTHHGSISILPDWSPDGETVYYTSFIDGHPNLWARSRKDAQSRRLLPAVVQGYGPRVSPDGRMVAFTHQEAGGNDLWLLDLATGRRERLTYHRASETSPDWAPDGWTLAFTTDRGGRPQIYRMQRDGSGEERLTFLPTYVDGADWSPAGDRLAFCAMVGGKLQLHVQDMLTNEVVQLTEGNFDNESPSWSPDGRMITFSSNRSGTSQIYLIRPDGTGLTQVTKSGSNSSPRWSPRPRDNSGEQP